MVVSFWSNYAKSGVTTNISAISAAFSLLYPKKITLLSNHFEKRSLGYMLLGKGYDDLLHESLKYDNYGNKNFYLRKLLSYNNFSVLNGCSYDGLENGLYYYLQVKRYCSQIYIANEMQDGSRVIVVRPPFAESWAFFIRKFGHRGIMRISELIRDKGCEEVILLLRMMIAGCQVFGITGEQGCGKTTMLKALIEFIPPEYTLRVQELLFELHLRDEYPERNIISFKETAEITGREALDLQKKTDGTVNIIGEVATAAVAGWLVMVSQVASRFTICTINLYSPK